MTAHRDAMARPKITAIIPTYNRRDLVLRAIGTALAQSLAVEEILVIDDGSTDGTGEAIRERHGDRVHCVRQENAGVSAARNRGLAMARGEYIALLDSDDEWLPLKCERQAAFLDARPDFGMVLCDVARTDGEGRPIDTFRRRDDLPEDGRVLRWVLRNPALAPVSAMFRREVFETVGGFDTALPTAEDIEFHLRVARRWPIGVVPETLARARLGHDEGLSALARTNDDYQGVVERFAAGCRGEVPDADLDAGIALAGIRNARGLVFQGRWAEAARLALRAFRLAPEWPIRQRALALAPLAARRALAQAAGAARGGSR